MQKIINLCYTFTIINYLNKTMVINLKEKENNVICNN